MYWLVCLPILEPEERTWTLLQNKTTYESDLSINFKFAIPELRVGTLDTLMVLSDDLVKVNALVESVVNKIRRQLFEMASPGRDDDFQEVSSFHVVCYGYSSYLILFPHPLPPPSPLSPPS